MRGPAGAPVSKYFFHVYDSIAIEDEVGTELESLTAARIEAVCRIGRYLLAAPEMVWQGDTWHMEVTDHKGFLFFRLDFRATSARTLSS
ncbi:MAG: DUF6894 family protein [Caulobacteraceae bacterium]